MSGITYQGVAKAFLRKGLRLANVYSETYGRFLVRLRADRRAANLKTGVSQQTERENETSQSPNCACRQENGRKRTPPYESRTMRSKSV